MSISSTNSTEILSFSRFLLEICNNNNNAQQQHTSALFHFFSVRKIKKATKLSG
jgi:hypothetical protein